MTPDFDPRDSSTWLPALTAEQVAAIYQRKVGGLKKSVQAKTFHPKPFQVQPYRWRRVDILRDVEGGRAMLRRVS